LIIGWSSRAVVLELVLAVGDPGHPLTEQPLGVIHRVLEGVADRLDPELLDVLLEPAVGQHPGLVLGVALGDPLLGDSDVHVDQVPGRLHRHVVAIEEERRHPEALRVALGRRGVERPVHRAADVGPVAERDREREQLVAGEHRAHDLDVVLMRPPGVGVVVDVHVPGVEVVDLLDEMLDRGLEGAHVRRLVALPVGDQPSVRGQDRDRVVVALGDRRRVRDALDQRAALVADRLEPVAQDLEGDRVEPQGRRALNGAGLHAHAPVPGPAPLPDGAGTASLPASMTTLTYLSTRADAPGGTSTVVSICSIIAGPSIFASGRSFDRS
jgi:hypothetical protein